MPLNSLTSYLKDSLELFAYSKKQAERAMAQVSDEQLFWSSTRAGIQLQSSRSMVATSAVAMGWTF